MDSRPVPAEHLTAGREYLDALAGLGLTPAFLGWAWDQVDNEWVLVLVTSIVDAGGPLPLNRLLFRAYNAKATPQQISPFIVRVISPELLGEKSPLFSVLHPEKFTISGPAGGPAISTEGKPVHVKNVINVFMDLVFETVNTYQLPPGAVERAFAGYHERLRDWQRFRRRVEALAA